MCEFWYNTLWKNTGWEIGERFAGSGGGFWTTTFWTSGMFGEKLSKEPAPAKNRVGCYGAMISCLIDMCGMLNDCASDFGGGVHDKMRI